MASKTTPSDLAARPSQVVFSEGTAVAEFRDDVARAGCVQVQVKVDASKCSVEIRPAVVNFRNVSLLTTVDQNGQPCSVLKDDVTANLTDPSGQAVPTQLQEKGRGLWEISYSPEVTGNHRLEVKVNGGSVAGSPFDARVRPMLKAVRRGKRRSVSARTSSQPPHQEHRKDGLRLAAGAASGQSVAGSPFDVSVQSRDTPVLTIGREGSGEGEISRPTDVAVDMDGNIAVVEWGNKRVQIVDARTGQSLRCFPVDGESPWGIDMDSGGQFIVTFDNNLFSTGNQAIRVYSREGKLTKTLKPDCLRDPIGVAVLQDGRMVVTDYTQKSCLLLQPDGSLIRDIGKGQLQNPLFIAVDESRDLFFVTDIDAHKVFVFDLEGKLKFSFGKLGQDEGQLYHPTGITVDPAGNIIVVNGDNCRLQVFGPDGTYLRTVATVKGGFPEGIALTLDNHIAVACYMGGCVELYRYKYSLIKYF